MIYLPYLLITYPLRTCNSTMVFTAGYSAREFIRCVISPQDLDHLEFWLQCEGADNPDKLLSDTNCNSVSQHQTGSTGNI